MVWLSLLRASYPYRWLSIAKIFLYCTYFVHGIRTLRRKRKRERGQKGFRKRRSLAQENRSNKKKSTKRISGGKKDCHAYLSIKRDEDNVLYLEVPNTECSSLVEVHNGKPVKVSAVSRLYVRNTN